MTARPASLLSPRPREGCTRETPRCDFWNWGTDQVRPDCCTAHMLELTTFAHELLVKHGITHWIDYGTLLGAVREGAFIVWDDDVDFGILDRDADRVLGLEREIAARGYVLRLDDPSAIRIQLSQVNEHHLDMIKWREQDGMLDSVMDPDYDWPGVPARAFSTQFLERLDEVELYGRPLPAPSPVHEFLVEHRYGPDYLIPQRGAISVWLYPPLSPEDMTPAVKQLVALLAERDHRLAELNLRSRFSHLRAWQAWRNAGRPLAPATPYLEAVRARVGQQAEPADKVEALIYAIAALEHAIDELEHPRPGDPLRRLLRRGLGFADLVAARAAGRPRRVFGLRRA